MSVPGRHLGAAALLVLLLVSAPHGVAQAADDPPFVIAVSPSAAGPVIVATSGAVSKPIATLAGLSFIVRDPIRPVFYAAQERGPRGRITALALTAVGRARILGSAATGAAPVDIAVDPLGRFLLTADYTGGSVTRVTLGVDGRPGQALTVKVPAGSGPNPLRQAAPHPHGVALSTDGRLAVVADLGGDALHVYDTATLRLLGTERLPPGSGPRTVAVIDAFTLAVTEELSGSVSLWRFDRGRLELAQRFALNSTIPSDVVVNVNDDSSLPGVLVIGRGTDEVVEVSSTGLGRRWALGRCGARVGRWSTNGELVLACGISGTLRRVRLDPDGRLTEGPSSDMRAISGMAFV